MIINGNALHDAQPIVTMASQKKVGFGGTSYGMSEAGYDIRIKQEVRFRKLLWFIPQVKVGTGKWKLGRFALASAIEEFQMTDRLVGVVHDKSTWARRSLSVFNTVIEPGWNGFLTLELVFHGKGELIIPAGSGIAQVIFHHTAEKASYNGKYQGQADEPVQAINS